MDKVMRSFAVVTTCNAEGYAQYGKHMLETFDRHFPPGIVLHVYAENFVPDIRSHRFIIHDLLASCPALVAFKERHKDRPIANGQEGRSRLRLICQWHKPRFKLRRIRWGVGYRWDAVRFSHKVFAISHAARDCQADVLIWMDADIRIFADISQSFLEELMPQECMLSCLRRPKFSECSFVAYNLRNPGIEIFFAFMDDFYINDTLFRKKEFHDSFLFDIARRRCEGLGYQTHDIAEGLGRSCHHVFINSRLGAYMDHMKGERKVSGGSNIEDLIQPRRELYWKSQPGA